MLKIVLSTMFLVLNVFASELEVNASVNLLFFGAFFMMLVYNLGYAFLNKGISYHHYFFFHSFVFVIMLFYTGQVSDTYLEFSIHRVPVFWFFLAVLIFLGFTKNYLQLDETHQSLSKALKVAQVILLAFASVSAFESDNKILINLGVSFIVILSFLTLSLAIYLSVVAKKTQAYFYLAGFSAIFSTLIFAFMSHFDFFEVSVNLIYFYEASILIEAAVFSFALAYKQKSTELNLRLEEVRKRQNETLFNELSHRVLNNLAQVISMLKKRKRHVVKEDLQECLQKTIDSVSIISLTHKKLQKSKIVGKVLLNTYIDSIIENHNTFNENNIHFSFEQHENIYISSDKATYIGLIINELITNSVKHAFKDISKPEINIMLTENETLELSYQDNGSGLNQEVSPCDNKDSQGSSLISDLARYLQASISVSSKNGYQFSLIFSN